VGPDYKAHHGLQKRLVEKRGGWDLVLRQQDEWPYGSADVAVYLVAQYANNGVRRDHPRIFAAQIDLLLQRILIRKILRGQGLVDDRNEWSAPRVSVAAH